MHRLSSGLAAIAPPDCILTLADLRLLSLDSSLQPARHITKQLSPQEQQNFSTFSYRKRALEWLGGRLAVKEAITKLPAWPTPPPASRLSVLAGESGRPQLITELNHNVKSVSISHSHDFTAAMASTRGNCGIDIQKMVPKIKKVVDKFTTQEEKSLFCDTDSLVTLTTIWTAKEAIKKSLLHDQPSLFQGIIINKVSKETEEKTTLTCSLTTSSFHNKIYVSALKFHDYIISFTWEDFHA